METGKAEITSFIDTKKCELASCANNLEFSRLFDEIKKHVSTLKHEHLVMKEANDILRNQVGDLQQDVRRPNLRIYGVNVGNIVTNDNIEGTVKQTITNMHLNMPGNVVDRAHRVGRRKEGR